MEQAKVIINGKEYGFKKPVLAIARKAAKFDSYSDPDKLTNILTDDAEFAKFATAWREFYEAAFENPTKELELENLMVPEVAEIISNFTLAMSGIERSLPAGSDTLPSSSATIAGAPN